MDLTIRNITRPIDEWAEYSPMTVEEIELRLSAEWSAEKAVFTPRLPVVDPGDLNPRKYMSRWRGVTFSEQKGKWCARIWYDGKNHYVHWGDSEIECARQYNLASREHHKGDGQMNTV